MAHDDHTDQVFTAIETKSNADSDTPTPKLVGNVRVSESDVSRLEMKWDNKIENRHYEWARQARDLSTRMEHAGKKKRLCHKVLGALSVTVPILSAAVVKLPMSEYDQAILVTVCFACSGILSALYGFMNYQFVMQQFFDYSSKYLAYATHIESLLDRPKQYRKPADQSQIENELMLAHLNEGAPTI